MKKSILIVLMLGFALQNLQAYTVSAKNDTDAAINLMWKGAGVGLMGNNGPMVTIKPGETGSLSTGGVCPWYAQISDASGIPNAPAPVDLNYSTESHCYNKFLTVRRQDAYRSSGGNYNIQVTGGSVPNLMSNQVTWRRFVVETNYPAHFNSGTPGGTTLYGAGPKCGNQSNETIQNCTENLGY